LVYYIFMPKPLKITRKKQTKKSSPKVARVKSKKAFRSYDEALKYLFGRTDYEKEVRLRYNITTFNLNRMKKLLSLLGKPHEKIHTAHIAGTKGKGSTATMLAKMIEANDYRVGLYTSPHVVSLHERIMVNSEMISKLEMLGLLNRIYAPVEKMAKTDCPTFFEIMTALAFMHFVDTKVDIAVIETGLGGRLDSTNVIKPKVVGITSLSIDHQYQAINCGLALAMLDKLKSSGYKIDNEKTTEGLDSVSLTGRMEMICDDPRIMIDAAHNAASVKALIHAIGQNVPYDSMVVIFGCNKDKDVEGMLRQLQYGADKVVFTRSSSAKAMSPQDLAEMYTEICRKMCQAAASLGEALRLAKSAVSKEDLICITGSFYLIGQAKARFQPTQSLQVK